MDGDDVRLHQQGVEVHLLDGMVGNVLVVELGAVDEVVEVEPCCKFSELAGYLPERREADCLADERFGGLADLQVPGSLFDYRSVLGGLSCDSEEE